jgi:CRISPR-associated endonuclease Csy4
MTHYINIRIKPDAEFRENVLLNKTFTKLHKTLHDLKQTRIGVSFPEPTKGQKSGGVYFLSGLGKVIRLHGSQPDLQALQDTNWLGGLSGYCDVSGILPVPETVEGYRTVSRIQPTMTEAKLKKRIEYQKANGDLKTDEDVKAYIKQYKAKMFASSLDNPYLELQSSSTGENYRIFIQFGELQSQPVAGEFNRFGLSKTATIPWF